MTVTHIYETCMSKHDEMIAYRAAALTGVLAMTADLRTFRITTEQAVRNGNTVEKELAIIADEHARAAYAIAHPEDETK